MYGDTKTSKDRLHGLKKSERTMKPLSSKYKEKLHSESKSKALESKLK